MQSLNSSFSAKSSPSWTTRFSLTPWTGRALKSETCYLTGSFTCRFHWSGLTRRCNNFAIQSSLLNLQLKRLAEKKQNLFKLLQFSLNLLAMKNLTPWTGSTLKSETCYLTGSFTCRFHWSGLTRRCNNFAIQSSLLNLQLKRLAEKKQNLFKLLQFSLNLMAMKNIILQWYYQDQGVCNR